MLPLPRVRNDGSFAQLDLEIELTMNKPISHLKSGRSMPRGQRGTMLIIALIVLVAMTLAGIATMRSVDMATLTAGNIAFRQASLNSADKGIQAGYQFLFGKSNTDLMNDVGGSGYYSAAPADEPDWSSPLTWQGKAAFVNGGAADPSGNVVSYIIHRLCTVAACMPGDKCGGQNNVCGSTPDPSTFDPSGQDHFRVTARLTKPPTYHYRITARSVGPRNSVSIVQVLVRP
jgi:type IV pilus assembly protein PilX